MFIYLNYDNAPHFVIYTNHNKKQQWPSTSVWMVPGTWAD